MIRSSVVRGTALAAALTLLLVPALLGCSAGRSGPPEPPAEPTTPSEPVPVEFDVPSGFTDTDDYRIAVPLHPVRTTRWVVPAGTRGLDVIAVTSYLLDADVSVEPDDRFPARLAGYADKVAAISATPPVRTTVAGHPAWQQSIVQPDDREPFRYDATFVFAGHFMVQVICQYDQRPEQISAACQEVLDTLRLVFV
ncbi:hypothetical protein [Plantactinospora sp. B5E13]|uniref:hypothetical protein n=1 Tax=unclassified Plantactinospora TaxID=2631981 RepID=UPI00325E7FB5